MDMESSTSIDEGIEAIKRMGIVLDFLILNAGISQRAFALDTDFSVDRRIMEVDYFGAIYLFKQLRHHFSDGREFHIAVTSSISGIFGFPLRSAYCAAKHAQIGFFEAVELEYPNIKVTILIPGRINTEISRSALLGKGESANEMDPGQAHGMDVNKAAETALKAIEKNRHKKLIGGKELLMTYFYKFAPSIFYKLGRNPRFYK
jgi:dehydrogenase/reductase SDR family member 7B